MMMIALHFVIQFENFSDSNMCIMQWPASDYFLKFSPYN